ncbi:hypothetical protein BgiBS90_017942, partial [Biomphalaria glabrata]
MPFTNTVTYFICKCANLESLQHCIQTGVWACQDRSNPPHPKDLLVSAYSQGSVVFIYSVNNQRGWHGYAQSVRDSLPESTNNYSQCDHSCDSKFCGKNFKQKVQGDSESSEDGSSTKTWYFFKIVWMKNFLDFNKQECLPFENTTELLLPDGTPLNKARNWQQVSQEVGRRVCCLIDEHHQKLCLEKQMKRMTKSSLYEESFLKQEEASITTETDGWVTAVEKVKRELGKVHLVCPFGSQRYNCSVAQSDQDIFIVYQAKTTQMLSLDPPRQTIKNSEKLFVDYTVLELQRYCELLLMGDQRCVETLFLSDTKALYLASPEWKELCRVRDKLLTKSCFEKYLKEAQGTNGLKQLEKWKVSNSEVEDLPPQLNKLAYICLRLLQNARYNCSVAQSDQDIFIVYQAKTTQMLSLDPPRQTIKNSEKLFVDYTVLELQRYCELLLMGDQRCVETLFLSDTKALYLASPEWKELCRVRDKLLTKSCFEKYLKEAQGTNGLKQLEKWKVSNSEVEDLPPQLNKLAYICLRLLQNA